MSLVVPKKSLISTNCRIWTPWSMCLHSLWWQNNFFYDILLDTSFSAPTSPSSSEDTAWALNHCDTRGFRTGMFWYYGPYAVRSWLQSDLYRLYRVRKCVGRSTTGNNSPQAALLTGYIQSICEKLAYGHWQVARLCGYNTRSFCLRPIYRNLWYWHIGAPSVSLAYWVQAPCPGRRLWSLRPPRWVYWTRC